MARCALLRCSALPLWALWGRFLDWGLGGGCTQLWGRCALIGALAEALRACAGVSLGAGKWVVDAPEGRHVAHIGGMREGRLEPVYPGRPLGLVLAAP